MEGYIIHLVHGLYYDSTRSLDTFGAWLESQGFTVVMHYYNPYSITSNVQMIKIINSLGANDIVIGHSFGGIIAQISNSQALVITLNTLGENTLKNPDDWLPATNDPLDLGGSGHGVDESEEYENIMEYISRAVQPDKTEEKEQALLDYFKQ